MAHVLDVPTGATLYSLVGHTDLVRSGLASPSSPSVLVTGSYDHTIRMWDTRAYAGRGFTAGGAVGGDEATSSSTSSSRGPACVLTLNHGAPVNSVIAHPSGNLFLTAGDNKVRVWDVMAGGGAAPLAELSNHQKAVTALALDRTATRLLSGGLDHHLKFYDMSSFQVVHSVKLPAPVLSVAFAPSNDLIAVGCTDGTLSLRKRADAQSVVGPQAARMGFFPPQSFAEYRDLSASFKRFNRGARFTGDGAGDLLVERERKQRLHGFDEQLKRFEYSQALDAALATRTPAVVAAVLEELLARSALAQAIGGRVEAALEPFLRFLIKHVTSPAYSTLLIDVAHATLDLYTPFLGQSVLVDDLFARLARRLADETALQTQCLQLKGELDLLLSAAAEVQLSTAHGPAAAAASASASAAATAAAGGSSMSDG